MPRHLSVPIESGSAARLLVALLEIAKRAPESRVIAMPADFHIDADRETLFQETTRAALTEVEADPEKVLLLGVKPSGPETRVGWVVPSKEGFGGYRRVLCYLEDPPTKVAEKLFAEGGLWSTSILVGTVSRLLSLYREYLPELWEACNTANAPSEVQALLASAGPDLGADLLELCAEELWTYPLVECGWRRQIPKSSRPELGRGLYAHRTNSHSTHHWFPPEAIRTSDSRVLRFVTP